MPDMSPTAVARRLDRLRALWLPMTLEQARAMMELPRTVASLNPEIVQRRLDELRALGDLAAYLTGTATHAPRSNPR